MFCKVVLPGDEIHKLAQVPQTFNELKALCERKYADKITPNPIFKYKDTDNELITIQADEDIETAIMTHKQENINTIRLFITPSESQKVQL